MMKKSSRIPVRPKSAISTSSTNSEAIFSPCDASTEEIPDEIIRRARLSGQLKYNNKNLTVIPDRIYRINELDDRERKDIDLSLDKLCQEQSWWDFVPVTVLDFSFNRITLLKSDIQNFAELKVLNLQYNNLHSLPQELNQLACLNELILNNNQLDSISSVYSLPQLYKLNVSNNNINTISKDIGNLTHLTVLNISNNKIETLPEDIGYMKALTHIDASNNLISYVPSEINMLSQLKVLDLNKNQLNSESLPLFLDMRNLTELNLSYNQLTKLPICTDCKNLSHLILGFNKIDDLENDYFLTLPKLSLLSLKNNKIAELCPNIGDLINLTILDLSDNELTNVPNELATLFHLKTLFLGGNPIKTVRNDILRDSKRIVSYIKTSHVNSHQVHTPDRNSQDSTSSEIKIDKYTLDRSKTLALSKVINIPESLYEIAQDVKVEQADLSHNRLSTVNSKLFNITSIRELDLSNNILQAVPPDILNLNKLVYLNLENNKLSDIGIDLNFPHLRELNLSYNKFKRIPESVFGLKSLEILMMNNNHLDEINQHDGLIQLNKLTVLDLSNNNIGKIPCELGLAKQLNHLNLIGNSFKYPRQDILHKGTPYLLSFLRDKLPRSDTPP
uniref:Leucine-rich repeat-containing protein 40 n=1 Tax=Cacopsylla melanoneura TaxID=428564 RepID=A0A8D8ZQI4_9HEMI